MQEEIFNNFLPMISMVSLRFPGADLLRKNEKGEKTVRGQGEGNGGD